MVGASIVADARAGHDGRSAGAGWGSDAEAHHNGGSVGAGWGYALVHYALGHKWAKWNAPNDP